MEKQNNEKKTITRTFVESLTYEAYNFEKGKAEKKGDFKIDHEPTNKEQKEIKEKFGITNLVLELVSKEEITLEMPISQFKELAKPVKKKEKETEQKKGE